MFSPPDWLQRLWEGMGVATFWAVIGRLMHMAMQLQAGKRRVFTKELCWEIPVAIGMGQVGAAVAQYFGLTGNMRDGVLVSIAYIGPRAIENLWGNVIRKKGIKP